MRKRILTTCPYCGCGCGLYLEVEDSRVIGAFPSSTHPVSRGALCVKGWNCYEFIHHPDRLCTPLIRKDGRLQKATWEEALTLVARRLKEISEQSGPDSLAFLGSAKCTNEENYLMAKLARAVFRTHNIDHCARLCHASTVTGLVASFGSGAMTNSISCFDGADCFLVTGSDTTEQHPLIGSRIINACTERGAKLILVDPRRIELSKFATIHLMPRPGTDVAWLNGMMNVIIKEGLENRRFIEERTQHFGKLVEAVRPYTPGRVAEICGIPPEQIIKAARIYAAAKNAMIVYAMGITQHTTGVDNVRSVANLAMLCGQVGRASTGVNPLRGQNNVQGACDVGALPDLYPGYQPVSKPENARKFADAWKIPPLRQEPGLTVTEIIDSAGRGSIRALYILGENPLISDPDINHARKCLEALDFLVVQEIFLSETARIADVVLPGASFAEKDGTFTSTERRVERIRKAVDPPGEAKPDWQIICDLAGRAGYPMKYRSACEIMDEIASIAPIYGGIHYDRLEPWGLQWPCPDRSHPGTPFLHGGRFTKGKGLFAPLEYRPPAEETDEQYPFLLTTGRVYYHWHTGTMTRRTSTLEREVPGPYVELNDADATDLGVKEGDAVLVTSRRGEISLPARITDKVRRKEMFIPFHFWEAPANILTIAAVDPVAKIPEYKVCAVRIRKL